MTTHDYIQGKYKARNGWYRPRLRISALTEGFVCSIIYGSVILYLLIEITCMFNCVFSKSFLWNIVTDIKIPID